MLRVLMMLCLLLDAAAAVKSVMPAYDGIAYAQRETGGEWDRHTL